MKNKYFLFYLFLIFCTFEVSAQEKASWSFGVELGGNYSNSSEDTSPLKKEKPILPKMGIFANYNMINNLFVESGVTYTMKGLKSEGKTEYLAASVKLWQHLLQVPLLITYRQPLKQNMDIGLGAGVYSACGIGGKTKAKGVVGGDEIDIEVNTFENILKRIDFGAILKLSFRYTHFITNLSYEYSLVDVGKSNVLGNPLSYKNRVYSLSVGYVF